MKKEEISICLRIVRQSIHRIDPYCLLEGGSPINEYDSEINSITSKLSRCESGRDVAHVISRVLNHSFSENYKPKSSRMRNKRYMKNLLNMALNGSITNCLSTFRQLKLAQLDV